MTPAKCLNPSINELIKLENRNSAKRETSHITWKFEKQISESWENGQTGVLLTDNKLHYRFYLLYIRTGIPGGIVILLYCACGLAVP